MFIICKNSSKTLLKLIKATLNTGVMEKKNAF